MTQKAKPFRYSPETQTKLETEPRRGTKYLPKKQPSLPKGSEGLIQAAADKCNLVKEVYPTDSNLIRAIQSMDENEIILALHGYREGELFKL